MDFLTFRSGAMQSLSLLKDKDKPKWNKTELEAWITKEYNRHYGQKEAAPLTT